MVKDICPKKVFVVILCGFFHWIGVQAGEEKVMRTHSFVEVEMKCTKLVAVPKEAE